MKKQSGITLIALVITIIVLLILAGLSISLVVGQNGVLTNAQKGVSSHQESEGREKLELELSSLNMDRISNKDYNSEEYLTEQLEKQGFIVYENFVNVDGYEFEIDREQLKIVNTLGKGYKNDGIVINLSQVIASDYSKSVLTIDIEYNDEISSIKLGNEELEIPAITDNKYTITKDIYSNGVFSVIVKDKKDGFAISKIEITEIAEDMSITGLSGILEFRDKVNAGATFEGKTITLTSDVYLNDVCGPTKGNWEPIGNAQNPFKGNFDGDNHVIYGLYIDNTNTDYQAFFGNVCGTKDKQCEIKNLIIGNDAKVYGKTRVAGIVANASYTDIEYCVNNAEVKGYSPEYQGGICGLALEGTNIYRCINNGAIYGPWSVGGIAGLISYADVKECYNTGTIGATINSTSSYSFGGIVGCAYEEAQVLNCYNTGIITGNYYVGGIAGSVAQNSLVQFCHNVKSVSGKNQVGSIVGFNSTDLKPYSNVYDCYYLSGTNSKGIGKSSGGTATATVKTAALFADKTTATDSVKNCLNTNNPEPVWIIKDTDYPILSWQVENNKK